MTDEELAQREQMPLIDADVAAPVNAAAALDVRDLRPSHARERDEPSRWGRASRPPEAQEDEGVQVDDRVR